MKVPTRKRGNVGDRVPVKAALNPSMKVPTRRRGNCGGLATTRPAGTSMKVPPPTRRWRNLAETDKASKGHYPHLYYLSAIELVIPPPMPRVASE